MDEIVLSMKDICKAFPGVQALQDVSFDVKKGEVHALVGENGAGKSTLIKVLGGVYQADKGEIERAGRAVRIGTPMETIRMGVSIIYQEFNLVPTLSAAENIFLGKELARGRGLTKRLDRAAMAREAKRVMERLDMPDLDVTAPVSSLSVAKQQLVEIGKALSNDTSILVMDEPTAVLTDREATALFGVLKNLTGHGISVIFVSHRLEEVQKLADRITVLRDGRKVATLDNSARDVPKDEIVRHMVGRDLVDYYPAAASGFRPSTEAVLKVEDLASGSHFEHVTFSLHKGEILGFSGLIGAGRTEIAMTLFGAYPKDAGRIEIDGAELGGGSIRESIEAGIALVPENRKESGLVLMMSVEDNIALPNGEKIARRGVMNLKKRRELAEEYIWDLSIRPDMPQRSVDAFSGGNQQKVVIAKWLAKAPKVLLMDEPTRGVDVAAKTEIYSLMRKLTTQGVSIVFISSEMPELMGMCDRILVIHEGCLTGEFDRKDFDQQAIMRAAAGIKEA